MTSVHHGAILLIVLSVSAYGQAPVIGACTVFPSNNIWNMRVGQLPVAANSSAYVNAIGSAAPLHPDFGTVYNGAPNGIAFVTVPGTQTKYPATFNYTSESDPGPYAIPLNTPIEGGSQSTGDRHVIAIDTDNCILYEMWSAYPQTTSWQAGSGAIFNLNSNALRPAGWTSADAAGLPIFPGLVRYDEVLAGSIHHALRFTVPQTQDSYVWPARHDASSLTGSQYPPMGVRFRLQANYDISSFSATNQVILNALKNYGMVIADNGSPWYLSGAPDPRWNDDDLHNLTQLKGGDFEVVDVSPFMVNTNSAQVVGSAGGQVFSFVAQDVLGASSIQYAQFLFSKSGVSALNACYISYDPVANVFYLLSDDMTQWYGLQAGSATSVGNAQCTIYGATSGSTKAGMDLTTKVDISFRSGFAGLKTMYQAYGDTSGNTSGWQQLGTWNDTGDPNAVELISLTPNSGTRVSQTFTAVTKDGNGATTIPFVELVITAEPVGSFNGNGCFIFYAQASNTFFLLNDVATAWSGLVAGSASSVSNSQCTLTGVGSGGAAVGSNLT